MSVSIDVNKDLVIDDVNADLIKVSAQMGFWGDVWAAAVEEYDVLDGHYRHWRAQYTKKLLESNDKLAEWKIKAEIEASPEFIALKVKLAACAGQTIRTSTQFKSYDKKGSSIQSKGANMRATIDAPNSTPSKDWTATDEESDTDEMEVERDIPRPTSEDRIAQLKNRGLFKKEKK